MFLLHTLNAIAIVFSYSNKNSEASGMTLKKTKMHIIIETKKVWVTLPFVSPLFLFIIVPVKEESFPPLHFHPEFKREKMKKANTKHSIKCPFLWQELQRSCF